MKFSALFPTSVLLASVAAVNAYEKQSRIFGWFMSPAQVEAKYLDIYQRCCMQSYEDLESDDSPCGCPVRLESGDQSFAWWNFWGYDFMSRWEQQCDVDGKIYEKASMDDFNEIKDESSIVDVAVSFTDSFSTLVELVTAEGLAETLSGPGPFTVFAPTNDAFAAIGDVDTLKGIDGLSDILLTHVVSGNAVSRTLSNGQVETLSGETVEINVDKGVTVNGANVVTADIITNNGVIHVIDAVINPAGGTLP